MADAFRTERIQACRDLSRNSEALWRRALGRGCLSKSLNDKDILYSHVKALSGWQLGKSNLFSEDPSSPKLSSSSSSAPLYSWDEALHASNWEEAETKFQPVLQCPVILEDLSRLPEAAEDATLELFTLLELLDYLGSSDWPATVRLRVIDGELLKIIIFALLSLEKRRLVDFHSLRAFANNRVNAPPQQEVIELKFEEAFGGQKEPPEIIPHNEEGTKKETKKPKKKKSKTGPAEIPETKAAAQVIEQTEARPSLVSASRSELSLMQPEEIKPELPVPYQTDQRFAYELLSIELVFFEKQVKSNIPFIKPDLENYDYTDDLPAPRHLPKDLTREPYSYKKYRSDKVRYPPYENFNLKTYIANLEEEIIEIKEKQIQRAEEAKVAALAEQSKNPPKDKLKGKEEPDTKQTKPSQEEQAQVQAQLSKIPSIEYIADDPYLEAEIPVATPNALSKAKSGKRSTVGSFVSLVGNRRSSQLGGWDQRRLTSLGLESSGVDLANTVSTRGKGTSVESSRHTIMDVSRTASSSLSSLVSSEGGDDDIDNSHLMQRLSLTNQELFISSLYEGREKNRRSAAEKLEQQRRKRAKELAVKANQALQTAVERAKGDLYTNFKHLARKRETERRRNSGPKVKNVKRKQIQAMSSMKSSHPESGKKSSFDKTYTKQNNVRALQKSHCVASSKQCLLPEQRLGLDQRKPLPAIKTLVDNDQKTKENSEKSSVKTGTYKGWDSYRNNQDHCEMESALNNELERGMLQRMPTRDFFPNYKKEGNVSTGATQIKGKNTKNKTQNNAENKNNNLEKMYSSYNLFLSAYNRTFKITEVDLKNSIINESFCVDQSGSRQKEIERPSVRRIDFSSPDHLIKYLVNVRCSLVNNRLRISWHPLQPQTSGNKNNGAKNVNVQTVWNFQRQIPVSKNTNNNGSKENSYNSDRIRLLTHSDKPPVSKKIRAEHSYPLSKVKLSVLDRNKSALSNTVLEPRESTALEESPILVSPGDMETAPEEQAKPEEGEGGFEGEDSEESFGLLMTESELLEQDLQSYQGTCSCDECEGQYALLAHLKPTNTTLTDIYGCPPILGHLRRDFRFLKTDRESVKERLDESGRVKLPERPPVLDATQVADRLLELMDDVMIRKEVLCSSRGFTYTTVTFTKLQGLDGGPHHMAND